MNYEFTPVASVIFERDIVTTFLYAFTHLHREFSRIYHESVEKSENTSKYEFAHIYAHLRHEFT